MSENNNKPKEKRYYLREAGQILNRRMSTLRKWEQLSVLPPELIPKRDERNWRYWSEEQLEGVKHWMRETDRRPGKGLPNYNPTEADLERAIQSMRKPHGKVRSTIPT